MKVKGKFLAFALACLMAFVQLPSAVFAAETTNTLTPDTLKKGKVGEYYSVNFEFSGTPSSNSWYIVGELPSGLTLGAQHSSDHPTISGTPTEAGSYTFTMQAKNRIGIDQLVTPIEKTYTLVIDPRDPLEIGRDSLWHGNVNAQYSCTVYTRDTDDIVTWSMSAADGETLPDGLSINAESGEITWENPVAGKYNLKVTATRDEESVSKVLKLIIEPEEGCKHTSAAKTERKAATCRQNGLVDYWYCDDCEYYFLDEECKNQTWRDLDELYTVAFHSDKNNDGKCDTCGKAMPIFKKVENADDVTSGGMYLAVSKIGDKYYTLKVPEEEYVQKIEAAEVTQNADGTFDYFEPDTGVMILKSEFAAECGDLDAGLPRYSLSTVVHNIPYGLQSDGNSIMMYSYEKSKYGYRINIESDKTASIASVYSEYWNTASEGGNDGVLSAYEETTDGIAKQYFSFAASDTLTPNSIELYKLTYVGETNGNNYTLSDAQSMVTINSEFTCVDSAESKSLSTVGGISEAVKASYVEDVISNQTDITGNIYAKTYADINLKSEESALNEWNETAINSLVYEIIPKLEIKGENTETPLVYEISDENFDGSEMTVSLCVGNMTPKQIIHHKSDGTKEYFYNEYSEQVKKGAKSFVLDNNYSNKGNFVTFTVDSFSDIEILATANEISCADGTLKVTVRNAGDYTLVLANYDDELTDVKVLTQTLTNGKNEIASLDGFVLKNGSKIFLWNDLKQIKPVCEAYDVVLE